MTKNNLITQQVEEYIAFKQALGFKLTVESAELRRFALFTVNQNHQGPLTIDLALNWVSMKPHYSRYYKARRLETVRLFAKYLLATGYAAEMPPTGIYGKCHGKTTPYIYTADEIVRLIANAKLLLPANGLRAKTMATLIGLLWSTGIRISEACSLEKADLDYHKSTLHIKATKFNKERIIPIHESVIAALKEYAVFRDGCYPNSITPAFFLSTGGKQLKLRNAEYAFTLIRSCLLPSGKLKWDRRPPRLYDLRHSFACHTIIRWSKEGVDVNQRLLLLSTYLGHVKPSDTYWYLTGTPELLSLSVKRFEELSINCSPGGCHEKR
jgi:integrase